MAKDPLKKVLDEIAERRAAGIDDLGPELRRRIDDLGAIPLNSGGRHNAFKEVIDAITPPGFDVFTLPDRCGIDPGDHGILVIGSVVDLSARQVVATIARHLHLDTATAEHQYLSIQKAYRNSGLAVLALDRSFRFYEQVGVTQVHVHAALETGRGYWARLGFDFKTPTDRALVLTWANLALFALGELPLPPDAPARRVAQLGTGEPAQEVSFAALHEAMAAYVTDTEDAERDALYARLAHVFSARLAADWTSEARFRQCAESNGTTFDEPVKLGRAIMLSGPDWHGVFDLGHHGSRDAFDEELNRALKKRARQP